MNDFKGVDLEDTFVLGWRYTADELVIDLEVSIWPEHSLYEVPKVGEYTCYKSGKLIFSNCEHVTGLKSQSEVQAISSSLDPVPDYGTIDTLVELSAGVFELIWEKEIVRIHSPKFQLIINP